MLYDCPDDGQPFVTQPGEKTVAGDGGCVDFLGDIEVPGFIIRVVVSLHFASGTN